MNTNAGGYRWGSTNQYYPGAGLAEGQVGVSNLTWETVTKYNLGLELGLWSAIDLQVDIFKERRNNIFMQRRTIPTQAGFASTPYANFGIVDNKGLEVALDIHKQLTPDLMVALRGNFTYAKNKIIEQDEPESIKGTHRSITGQSVSTLWGYTAERLYTDADFDENGNLLEGIPVPELNPNGVRPGDIKYADLNDDGVVNSKDEGYVGGVTMPRIIYGFGGNVIFKGFDFSFFFQGSADAHRIIAGSDNRFIPGSSAGTIGNVFANYTDRWTPENPSQDVFWPRLSYGTNTNNQQSSTWFKKDMSFLRLKTIELGYSLPTKITQKYGSTQTRFFISGNDLFHFSKFKLWDPELDTNDGLKYPNQRSFMFGVDLKF